MHYSFFFSLCLRSLFLSLLAIPMYFKMIPCWFSPGSKSKKVTLRWLRRRLWTCCPTQATAAREMIMVMKYVLGFSSFSAKRRFHQPTALRRAFTRLLQIPWNLCRCSVVHLLEPKILGARMGTR